MDFILHGDEYTYKPAEDTLLIYSRIVDEAISRYNIYDVGTGSGIIALTTAKIGLYAIGIDIFYNAVKNAYENSFINKLDSNTDFISGDMLESLRLDIDNLIIVSNPPYLPGSYKDYSDYLYIGGEGGIEFINKLIKYFSDSKAVKLLFILSSYTDINRLKNIIDSYGLKMILIDIIALNSESIYLYKVIR